MIKLINILKEGIISLTQDERDQIEKLIPYIIEIIKGPEIKSGEYREVDWINFQYADKTPGKVFVFVGNDSPKAGAYFQTKDPKNPTDNYIVVQQNNYSPYFGFLNKMYSDFVGDKNQGVELLRSVLKHELIHAKDPALNHHYMKEPYDFSKQEVYYKSWAEFQTMTGQFFEAIISGVGRVLTSDSSKENIKKVENALDDILNFYSGKSKSMSQDTADFIQDTGQRDIFQSLIKSAENLFKGLIRGLTRTTISTNALDIYSLFINSIKTYNPEGYKEFLKDLYKVIDEARDKIKAFKLKPADAVLTESLNGKKTLTMKDQLITKLIKEALKKRLTESPLDQLSDLILDIRSLQKQHPEMRSEFESIVSKIEMIQDSMG